MWAAILLFSRPVLLTRNAAAIVATSAQNSRVCAVLVSIDAFKPVALHFLLHSCASWNHLFRANAFQLVRAFDLEAGAIRAYPTLLPRRHRRPADFGAKAAHVAAEVVFGELQGIKV